MSNIQRRLLDEEINGHQNNENQHNAHDYSHRINNSENEESSVHQIAENRIDQTQNSNPTTVNSLFYCF